MHNKHKVSVIIPTYNPKGSAITSVIDHLKNQSMSSTFWQLIVVDNNSDNGELETLDLSWHTNARIIKCFQQGLTFARLAGFKHSSAEIIVMVDDDNLLDKDYLMNAVNIFKNNQNLGVIGGRSIAKYEKNPPSWIFECNGLLAIRDLGASAIIEHWQNKYPHSAPIGAGMCIRTKALSTYMLNQADTTHQITDRTEKILSSGGDNDIILEVMKSGFSCGYFPALSLVHILPTERLEKFYLSKLSFGINKSWILVLDKHGINPWKPIHGNTLLLRKIKSWFLYQAWKNELTYIQWKGACGRYEGLASIYNARG